MTDPISDMFVRIKNAQTAGHERAVLPYSKFKHEIARMLERAGLIAGVERHGKKVRKLLDLVLRYHDSSPAIRAVKMLSTPGRRSYAPWRRMPLSSRGGIIVVSTPQGLKTSAEARRAKVGGQLIAEIW